MGEQGRRRRRGRRPVSRCPAHAGAAPQASHWENASRNLRISEDSCPPSRPLPLLRESVRLRGVGALVPWQWLASPALFPLSRCCAAEIQQALLDVLAGEAFLADKPWSEMWWGRMQLDLASGWRLQIAIDQGQLGALMRAQAPDGRNWDYGCQRDDWTLGPDSQIVEPVGLLRPGQRQELERLLREACCWPPPEIRCELVFPTGIWKPVKPSRRKPPRSKVSPRTDRAQGISRTRPQSSPTQSGS